MGTLLLLAFSHGFCFLAGCRYAKLRRERLLWEQGAELEVRPAPYGSDELGTRRKP